MKGKNVGIFHSCRSKWHSFGECTRKCRCPRCPRGFQKCFEVEKQTSNKGRLFNTCSNNCGFFDWVDEGQTSEEVSTDNEVINVAGNEEVEDLSSMLDTLARVTEKQVIEVSLRVTFRKGK
ncbi:Hypothetical predicted protein [Olea europaea subsp. europaea]|uniref:Zinc finger GRF-type domain-containing protein n=1 Tax=Olea europaea subsp. europaea TaxID=158383 RepID=A0A8S0R7B0_OLEEU|nr:Hypothetical predicted protein [Olea europaea subsp. europaea]